MEKLNFSKFKERMLKITRDGRSVLITAPSGSGKSYLASKLRAMDLEIHSLDREASGMKKGNWVTDLLKVQTHERIPGSSTIVGCIWEGTSHNIKEVAAKFDVIVMIFPDYRTSCLINAAKAKEGIEKGFAFYDGKRKWLMTWIDRAVRSRREWHTDMEELIHEMALANVDAPVLLFEMPFDGNQIQHGWHRD